MLVGTFIKLLLKLGFFYVNDDLHSFLLRLFKAAAVTLKCEHGFRNICELLWSRSRTSFEARPGSMAAHQQTTENFREKEETIKQNQTRWRLRQTPNMTEQCFLIPLTTADLHPTEMLLTKQ